MWKNKFFPSITQWETGWGVIFIIISALGFSAKSIFVKLAFREVPDSILILTLRMGFSLPFFLLGIYFKKENLPYEPTLYFRIFIMGVIGYYFASIFDFFGLETIPAGLERIILFSYPTVVVLLSALVYGKKIEKLDILSLVLTYGGIFSIFWTEKELMNSEMISGSLWVFLASISYAGYLVGSDTMISKLGGVLFTSLAMSIAVLAIILHFFIVRPPELLFQQSSNIYLLSFLMAIISTVVPVFLLSQGIRRIGSSRSAIIGSIGPVSTLYMSQIFLGDTIHTGEIYGTILLILGVLLVSTRKKQVAEIDS